MSLLSGKHIVKEVQEIRCTIVETGATRERVDFLKDLLELNGYEVKVEEEVKKAPPPPKEGEEPAPVEETPTTYTIGVTDIIFNPVIAVYQRMLRTKDGRHVTADYWNQKTDETEPNYWDLSKK